MKLYRELDLFFIFVSNESSVVYCWTRKGRTNGKSRIYKFKTKKHTHTENLSIIHWISWMAMPTPCMLYMYVATIVVAVTSYNDTTNTSTATIAGNNSKQHHHHQANVVPTMVESLKEISIFTFYIWYRCTATHQIEL